MSAAKARKPRTVPAAEVIPLEALTITWRRRRRYLGEPGGGVDLTITGAQLAAVLGTLAEEEPQGKWDTLGDSRDVAEILDSMHEVMFGLMASEGPGAYDPLDVLYGVHRYLSSLAAPLRGHREREAILKGATVTITRKPAAEVAS
jgi:hypothetical protein